MSIHACCTGCTVPFFASPSIVVICLSSTEATGVTQDVVGVPSTRTMHAPHWDIPHPNFLPVSPRSSRRANWRVTPSTSGRVYSLPLTESFALVISVFLTRWRGPRDRPPHEQHVEKPEVSGLDQRPPTAKLGGLEQARGEDDVDHLARRGAPDPVPLQLARQAHPTDRLSSCLHDALQTGPVRLGGRTGNGVNHRVDLVARLERVERREGEAHFGPQRRHDQLLVSGGFDRLAELGVLPGVDRRPIDLAAVGQHLLELGDGGGSRPLAATPTVESTIGR